MKFFWEMATDWPIGTIASILVCVVIFYGVGLIVNIANSHTETLHVTVIEKSYKSSSTKGGGTVIVTSNPEKHTLFVQQEGGEPFPVNVDRNIWLKAERGKTIDLEVRIGWITGNILD